jgi:hypothetical protein
VDLIRYDDIWTSLVSESHSDDQPAHPNRPQTLQQGQRFDGLTRLWVPSSVESGFWSAVFRSSMLHAGARSSQCIIVHCAKSFRRSSCSDHVYHQLFLQEKSCHQRTSGHIIPLPTCSLRSCHTVFPEQLHTVLSLSQTPALRAITPTRVFGSSV